MPHNLIQKAQSEGIFLYSEKGALKYRSSKGKPSQALASELKQNKVALIHFLEQHQDSKKSSLPTINYESRGPLSYSQSRVFYLESMGSNDALYHMTSAFRLKGKVDIQRIEASINHIAQRHSILRTGFEIIDGVPHQKRNDDVNIKVSLNSYAIEEGVWLARESNLAFDLEKPPLIRVSALVNEKSNETLLLFVFHHLVFDGYSYRCFYKEFNQTYAALKENNKAALPELAYQYSDFSRWQQSDENVISIAAQEYWVKKMAGVNDVNSLPTDYPRSKEQQSEGALIKEKFNANTTARIRQFAQSQGISLFTLFSSVYAILISRWNDNPDVVIGTPTAGRDIEGSRELIGFFANTLIIRSNISCQKSFIELLEESKKDLADAFRFQSMPFEKIVESIGHERSHLNAPILQLLFVMNQADEESLSLAECDAKTVLVDRNKINFEFELHITDNSDSLDVYWLYAKNLFSYETADAFKESFSCLLDGIIKQPNIPLSKISIASDKALAQISQWNSTEAIFDEHLNFADRFEKQAKLNGNKVACSWQDEDNTTHTISYAELNEKTNNLANHLVSKGAKPNACVGMAYSTCVNAVIGIVGILKSGAAYVPLDSRQPISRLSKIIESADIQLLIAPDELSNELGTAIQGVDLATTELSANVDATNKLIVQVDTGRLESSLAYVIFTSGSTGEPKGVMIEHQNLNNLMSSLQPIIGYQSRDIVTSMTAPSFDIHVAEILMPLISGAQIHILNWEQARSPNEIQAAIKNHNISIMQATPAVWQLLVDDGFIAASGFKMITGGDHLSLRLRKQLLQQSPKAKLFNLYAPSEATVYCSGNQTQLDTANIHIGKPFPNNRYYILDNALNPLPIGCAGELFIAGANIARGYLNNEELSEALFSEDPFCNSNYNKMYRTGDLARRLADGSVALLGRKDFQLKLNGIRIEANDIEAHLLAFNEIEKAVVTLQDNPAGESLLVAYLVSNETQKLDSDEIRARLTLTLPIGMIPSEFIYLDALPLTSNFKIDRKALPKLSQQHTYKKAILASSPTEKAIAIIWQSLLSCADIDINRNFFSLGGHSLLAIKMLSQVNKQFQVNISLKSLISHGTVAQLATLVSKAISKTSNKSRHLEVIPKRSHEADAALSFSQLRLWGLDAIETKGKHYCVPLKYSVKGEVNLAALQRSFELLRQRHEVLRSAYVQADQTPIQIPLDDELALAFYQYHDLRQDKKREENNTAHLLLDIEHDLFEKAFLLEKGDVFRVGLVQLGDEDYLLFIAVHHISIDGESLPILIREVSHFYNQLIKGDSIELEPLAIQYADYAVWQRNTCEKDISQMRSSEEYWKSRLADIPSTHGLPLDYPRPAKLSYRGDDIVYSLNSDICSHLIHYTKSNETTVFTVLYSALSVLLCRYSGLHDVVIGTPAANRDGEGTDKLIGFFVNSIALRTKLDKKVSFNSLVSQSKENLLSDFDHQSFPFEKVLQTTDVLRKLQYHPIFQVMIVLEHKTEEGIELDHLHLTPLPLNNSEARFDLTLNIRLEGNDVRLNWNYATDIFKQSRITKVAEHFENLLKACLKQPEKEVFSHPLQDPHTLAANKSPLPNINASSSDTLLSLFKNSVIRSPLSKALAFKDQYMSYQALDQASNALAHALIDKGIKHKQLVGIQLERSNNMIIAMLGVQKTGSAYLPIDPKTPKARLNYMLANSNAALLITDQTDSVEENLAINFPCKYTSYESLDISAKNYPLTTPDIESALSTDIAYVIYTSGSTGQPKGVMVEHKGVVNYINEQANYLDLTVDESANSNGFLYLTNFAFDTSIASIWGALSNARCLHIVPEEERFDLTSLNQYLCQPEKYCVAYIPPILLAQLSVDENTTIIPNIVVSGESVDQKLVDHYQDKTRLINEYGPTENSVCSTYHVYQQGDQANKIGQCIRGVKAYVLDEAYNPVPYGVTGELYLAGIGLSRGYLNQAEQTKAAFLPNVTGFSTSLYKTGDLVKEDSDGQLFFVGRKDNQVKIRGFRVELTEIERQLIKSPEVESVKVQLKNNEAGDKQLVAYLVSRQNNLNFEALFNALVLILPDYMVPKLWAKLDDWPLTDNGKLDVKRLPEPLPIKQNLYVQPQSKNEITLFELWTHLLNLEHISINDNFFALGGDSIKAMQLVARASSSGLHFSVKDVFENPTIGSLSLQVKETHTLSISQEASMGKLDLLPIQREFFNYANNGNQSHFNQSALLKLPNSFTYDTLHAFVTVLIQRHDALRLTFTTDHGRFDSLEDLSHICSEFVFSELDDKQIKKVCADAQKGLDIENGPLFKTILFRSPNETKLFITVHHLIIDAVSWNILIDDLKYFHSAYNKNNTCQLADKTSSYQEWSALVNDKNTLNKVRNEEQTYWQEVIKGIEQIKPLPISERMSQVGGRRHLAMTLCHETTNKLLKDAKVSFNSEVFELILSGIYLGVQNWKREHKEFQNDSEKLAFSIETHGREGLDNNLDISQTIGWFTSNYPLVLKSDDLSSIESLVCSIKEQIRQVPNKGVGFGILNWLAPKPIMNKSPDILFNYFGQQDLEKDLTSEISLLDTYTGDDGTLNHMCPHALAINSRITKGQLNLDLSYDLANFSSHEIEALRTFIENGIRSIVDFCSNYVGVKKTPSDFPLAKITQEDIDGWQRSISRKSVNILNIYPATGMQEGLLYHSEIQSDAYLTQLVLSYKNLNPDRFKQAWQHVLNRYDILRTAFLTSSNGERYQVVTDSQEIDWRFIDASNQETNKNLKEIGDQDKSLGFDANQPGLLRFTLVCISSNEYKLIWTNHHALLDGWCLPVILSELKRHYQQLLGQPNVQESLTSPYVNYIKWLQDQDRQTALNYWQKQLVDFSEPTPLPFSTSNRGSQAESNPIEQVLTLSLAETLSLRSLAQTTKCTLNALIQGAWALLLSQYSDQDNVVFGATVSGRPPEIKGIESMVGLFINTLPVMIKVQPDSLLSTWLEAIHIQHMANESQSFLPLQDIQEIKKNQPLFQSILVFENYPVDESLQGNNDEYAFECTNLESKESTNYAISLIVSEQAQLEFKLLSSTDHLQPWQIEQILGHLKHLLIQMTLTDNQTIGDMSVLSAQDIHYQTIELNNDGLTQNKPSENVLNLSESFKRCVSSSPEKLALMSETKSLTYKELDFQANCLANVLTSRGVRRLDHVGIFMDRSTEMVVCMLAILKVGAVYIPLDSKYPSNRLALMIEKGDIQLVICADTTHSLGQKLHDNLLNIDTCLLGASMQKEINNNPIIEISQPAYIMFTSGSTGEPKGTIISHESILSLVSKPNFVSLEASKNIAQISNFSFDAATFEIWGALLNGASLHIISDDAVQSPNTFSDTLLKQSIDIVFMTTALVNQLVSLKPDIFSSLDTLLFGGEKVDHSIVDTILTSGKPKHLVHVYGPTENTTFSTFHEINDIADNYPIGKPVTDTKAYILSKNKKLVPFGQVGELHLGGKGLSSGYLKQEAFTQEKFIDSPFNHDRGEKLYCTGDLVRYLNNGAIEFVGRRDDQIKLRGYRIETMEVLSHVLAYKKIKQATIELIDREENARLVAAVTLQNDNQTQAQIDALKGRLNEFLSSNMPSYMVPKEYHILTNMPVTQNGKINRKAVRKIILENQESKQVNTASPRDNIEMSLYQIWLSILTSKDIGIRDNFFEIGGSSISAIKVIHKIEQDWSVKIAISDMLKSPTIESLGGLIRRYKEKGERQPKNELIQFREGEGEVNVICPHLGGGTSFGYLSLAKVLPDSYGVYGIQARGVDTDDPFLPNVQAMADYYLTLINPLIKQKHVFVGCSYGGYVAFEMARILTAAGHQSRAILLDSEGTNNKAVLDSIQPVSLEIFRQKLITYNGMYPNIDDQQIDRYFRVYNHHLTSLKTMVLEETEAKTMVVLATGDKSDDYLQSLTRFWREKVKGEFVIKHVEGDHSTMLEAPSVLHVANWIQAEFNE